MVKTKKFLSLALVLIMLFSVVPMGVAFGADENSVIFLNFDYTIIGIYDAELLAELAKQDYVLPSVSRVYDASYHYIFRGWVLSGTTEPIYKKASELPTIAGGTIYIPSFLAVSHTYDITIETSPTCSTEGYVAKECICGCSGELVDIIPPAGHTLDENTLVTIAPTCTKPGMSTGICTMCREEISRILPATGEHTLETIHQGRDPSCTNEGWTSHKICMYCSHLEESTIIPALGHIDIDSDLICDRCFSMLEMPEPEEPTYYIENGFYYTVENGKATIVGVDYEISGEIVIPSTLGGYPVIAIGDSAFTECFWLTGITIPETVESIGETAFAYSIALKEIVIPESVTSIGEYAFACCISLEKIVFKNSNAEIGEYIGYTDMTVKEGFTTDEWVEKFYAIIDAELNGGAVDSLYDEIIAISDIYNDIVVNPNLTIYGYEPSTAHTFATANNIRFKNISEYFENDVDTATGVEVVYPDDAFDTEVEFVVKENGANANVVLSGEFAKYKSYDISFEIDGEKIQPNGKVTVKLPVPADFKAESIAVYYIDGNGNKTRLNSKVENGYVVFETDHFSEYVIVDESSKIEEPDEPNTPEVPDEPDIPDEPCTCKCHGNFIQRIIFKITNFFAKLFNPSKRVCACGVKH